MSRRSGSDCGIFFADNRINSCAALIRLPTSPDGATSFHSSVCDGAPCPRVCGTMLDFMDYIQLAFAEATNWNRDNSYSSLTTTAQCKSPVFRDAPGAHSNIVPQLFWISLLLRDCAYDSRRSRLPISQPATHLVLWGCSMDPYRISSAPSHFTTRRAEAH